MWLIIGISGVTCSGKSTLANSLRNIFVSKRDCKICGTSVVIGDTFLINQDTYFRSTNDPSHERIEELNHNNWEILTALDMDRMIADIENILSDDFVLYKKTTMDTSEPKECPALCRVNILIVEGFLIFNHSRLMDLLQMKFHLHLPYEKCYERRIARTYDPPDVTGYFEMVVWPFYERHLREFHDNEDVFMLNGELPKERILKHVLKHINDFF